MCANISKLPCVITKAKTNKSKNEALPITSVCCIISIVLRIPSAV